MSRKKGTEPEQKPLLSAPAVIQPKTGFWGSFCFYAALAALGGAGAMGCLITAFTIPGTLWKLISFGVFCACLCAAQFLLPRWRWPAALTTLGIWTLCLGWKIKDVTRGFHLIFNIISQAFSERLNFQLPRFDVRAELRRPVDACTLFLLFLEFLLFWVLSWLLIRCKSTLGSFAWTGLFLLVPLSFSIMPAGWALGLLFLFWIFLLMASPAMGRTSRLTEKQRRISVAGTAFLRPVSLLILPALALSMLAVYRIWSPESYKRPQIANQVRSTLTESANLPAVFRGGSGGGGHRVNLAKLGDRSFNGQTVLQTRHRQHGFSDMQKDYLKDFVGSVYTGASWERLASEDAKEAESILGAVPAQTLAANLLEDLPTENPNHYCKYDLSVRKLNVDMRSIYAPYGLYTAEEGLPDGVGYIDDGHLRSSRWFSGPRDYTLTAAALPAQGSCLYSRFDKYAAYESLFESDVKLYGSFSSDSASVTIQSGADSSGGQKIFVDSIDDPLSSLFQQTFRTARLETPDISPDLLPLPQEVKDRVENDEARAMVERIEHYSQFVYDHYTQLPDNLREYLQGFMAQHHLEVPAVWKVSDIDSRYQDYVNQVKRLLATEYTYTLKPEKLPEGWDFASYFLGVSKEGYCVHFATAAVVLLRAAGIPARYAEGYVVPVDQDGKWVNVPDYNAHAWVEIYWGGSGWLPVEVTPAGPDVPAAYDNAIGPDPEEPDNTGLRPGLPTGDRQNLAELPEDLLTGPGKTEDFLNPTPSAAPAAPGSSAQEEGKQLHPLIYLAVSLTILALPFLLILLSRWIRIARRKRKFRQPDRNKALLCVYVHLLRLYRENYVLPYGSVDPPEEVELLALKARFSNHEITQQELDGLVDTAAQLEEKLDKNLYGFYRIRCKYLLALF